MSQPVVGLGLYPEGAPKVHGSRACVDWMRDTLLDDIEDLTSNAPARREWKSATKDAEVRFPSPEDIQAENFGPWVEAIKNQVENASGKQLDLYFREKYPDAECSACELELGKK